MPTTATATRKYEMFLALLPTLTDKEVTKELEAIKELASRHGGVFHEQIWGRRDLYYEIAGQTKGVYAVICFDYDPSMLSEMRSELALNTTLLRYNIQGLPEDYVAPVRTSKEDKASASDETEEQPKARVVKKKAAQPVPSEMTAPASEAPTEETSAIEPAIVVEESAEESAEESNSRKKVKHKDLDEGLNRILSDLGSQS